MDLPAYLIHWNAPTWCARAARSLQASEGVRVGVHVVDNGPHDTSLASALPAGVEVLQAARNGGYTGGCNIAFRHCLRAYPAAKFCLIASHDLQVEPRTLHQLVTAAEAHPEFGVLAPVLTAPSISWGGSWDGYRPHNLRSGPSELVERDWASGTCLLVRLECAAQVGGFDESFGSYVEDVDFCLRAKDAGFRVGVLGSAKAAGIGTASKRAGALQEANIILLCSKRGGWRAGWAAWFRLAAQAGERLLARIHLRSARPRGPSLRSASLGCALALAHLLSRPRSRPQGGLP